MHFFRVLCLLFGIVVQLQGYESGFEESFEEADEVDCLSMLKKSYDESDPLWTETHCKKTAQAIVSFFKEKGMVENNSEYACDWDDFANSAMGKALLATSKDPEHRLFLVNVCGSAHVFVVEKTGADHQMYYRIFQSWQREFTLAQWLNVKRWNNQKLEDDFYTYGAGQQITQPQFTTFLHNEVAQGRGKLQNYREFGLAVPYELAVASFKVNQIKQD